ncbi:MAG TPA: zinc-finger domain-containing protein [Hellea balneolensis]|uniref:Zinc-finger domain-containing protein n=1 Tax=Hellea balneolensis TaxID=287478 RepID=A0A7C5R015_9PROT|nr:zinc-finger domain-containing protein [Hellea balneolensis]
MIETKSRHVSCDGGGGVLGHPRVFMEMGPEDFVVCKYCDKKYVLKKD